MSSGLVIAIMGKSGAGKTRLQGSLETHLGLPKFHAIHPLKCFIENVYHLPPGSMDDPAFKNSIIPGTTDKTFLDLMVELFHFWSSFDVGFSQGLVASTLRQASSKPFTISGIRRDIEVEAIVNYCRTSSTRIMVISLINRGVLLASDVGYWECIRTFGSQGVEIFEINNQEGTPWEEVEAAAIAIVRPAL